MGQSLEHRILRASELLKSVNHAAMATVNQDGSPHNTPYFFMINADLTELYWGSHPESLHSKNVLRDGKLFVVIYDAMESGGLYISAKNGSIAEGEGFERALLEHNRRRTRRGRDELPSSYYQDEAPQRMWAADIDEFWVHVSTRDESGRLDRDLRQVVTADQLKS